jgi:hypothetical protein
VTNRFGILLCRVGYITGTWRLCEMEYLTEFVNLPSRGTGVAFRSPNAGNCIALLQGLCILGRLHLATGISACAPESQAAAPKLGLRYFSARRLLGYMNSLSSARRLCWDRILAPHARAPPSLAPPRARNLQAGPTPRLRTGRAPKAN